MQSDTAAYSVDVVQTDFIKKTCPKEYKEFLAVRARIKLEKDLQIKEKPTPWTPTEEHITFLDVSNNQDMKTAYFKLRNVFQEKTGLELFIDWHDSKEYGSSQDDVDGEFWFVTGARILSPAGEKYKDKIQITLFGATYIVSE